MPVENFKRFALQGGVTALAVLCLLISSAQAAPPSLLDVVWFSGLLILTLAVGRFAASSVNADGAGQSYKTPADTFIFLAALLYSAPAAMLLAAANSAYLSRGERDWRRRLFSVSAAAVSICLAVAVSRWWTEFLTGQPIVSGEQATHLGLLLVPLLALGIVQYALSTSASILYHAFETGEVRFHLSQESLVWSALTQLTSAVSAAFVYSALHGGEISYVLVGVFINALVYMLYRFNEGRVEAMRRSQQAKLRHAEEIAELHLNTIESLAIAIDAKDQTTHGHVRRTQIYALELGKLLGVGESDLMALRAGALLHDVGKLAVPEYILNKPGKLTAAEFEKMKIHTIVGGDIVKRVGFPYPVEDIVRSHHEKWDGSGYPQGLKREAIPLVARIISVVDFYDATRCDRPYRVGMKREESLALLRKMAGSSFDPHVVGVFINHIEFFDQLIAEQDIQEQVASADEHPGLAGARPDAGLASDILGTANEDAGYRSIVKAQREVCALHEIAQTISSSLNLQDTVALIAGKLSSIVPFDTCVIYLVDDLSGRARAVHVTGEHAEVFTNRRITIGEGITGWVIANARTMCNTPPELDLVGIPDETAETIKGVLVAPLLSENGAFGALTLYSLTRATYTTEQVRLLESVSQHASIALHNALAFEKTKECALIDSLTEMPNARSFHLSLEQRLAECRRLNFEPLTVLCVDLDEFKSINDAYGHGVGDRVLHGVAAAIKKELRQMDTLARYAGDEFVAIMPMASADVSGMIAERLRDGVESQRFPVRTGTSIQVKLSVGLATFPADGETAEQLLNSAVGAMQQDKHARRLQLSPATSVITAIDAYR